MSRPCWAGHSTIRLRASCSVLSWWIASTTAVRSVRSMPRFASSATTTLAGPRTTRRRRPPRTRAGTRRPRRRPRVDPRRRHTWAVEGQTKPPAPRLGQPGALLGVEATLRGGQPANTERLHPGSSPAGGPGDPRRRTREEVGQRPGGVVVRKSGGRDEVLDQRGLLLVRPRLPVGPVPEVGTPTRPGESPRRDEVLVVMSAPQSVSRSAEASSASISCAAARTAASEPRRPAGRPTSRPRWPQDRQLVDHHAAHVQRRGHQRVRGRVVDVDPKAPACRLGNRRHGLVFIHHPLVAGRQCSDPTGVVVEAGLVRGGARLAQ